LASSYASFLSYFGNSRGKILKIFHGDNQYIKRKIKYFLPKHLVEIKKGCIFALANQERKSS
jgi:hypothetical protein